MISGIFIFCIFGAEYYYWESGPRHQPAGLWRYIFFLSPCFLYILQYKYLGT
jgi:hypothetical protein